MPKNEKNAVECMILQQGAWWNARQDLAQLMQVGIRANWMKMRWTSTNPIWVYSRSL